MAKKLSPIPPAPTMDHALMMQAGETLGEMSDGNTPETKENTMRKAIDYLNKQR